jgi:hypothetical protein
LKWKNKTFRKLATNSKKDRSANEKHKVSQASWLQGRTFLQTKKEIFFHFFFQGAVKKAAQFKMSTGIVPY